MKTERVGQFDVERIKVGHRAVCRYCHAASIGAYYEDLEDAVRLHVCGTPKEHTTTIPADLPHRPADPAPLAMAPEDSPAAKRDLPAYLSLPACPACRSLCGMLGEHHDVGLGNLVCASCGTIWPGTVTERDQCSRAWTSWEQRTDGTPGPYAAVVRRRAKRITDRRQLSVLEIGRDPRFERGHG